MRWIQCVLGMLGGLPPINQITSVRVYNLGNDIIFTTNLQQENDGALLLCDIKRTINLKMWDPKILSLFNEFNKKYFWGKLDKVRVSWSPRMTLCAGKTAYKVRGNKFSSCAIRLSQPLLTQRPHSDTVNTLLHEMIHAYLHVTQGLNYRDSHGPEFRNHMKRINALHGSKITIYHNFHREVNKFRIHVYRCDGPCVSRRPFFGVLRRAIERPPGPTDRWWQRHAQECGGTFRKIEGPGVKSPTVSRTSNVNANKPSKDVLKKLPINQDRLIDKKRVVASNGKEIVNSERNRERLKMDPRSSNQNAKTKPFDEEKILQRIKEKYSNTKQTKLITMEETPGLSLGVNCRLVEGNMNYNYQAKSPTKIKIEKYIRRFREAKNLFGSETSRSEDESKTKAKMLQTTLPSSNQFPNISTCPVCNIEVPDTMYGEHINQCFGEDINFDSDFDDDHKSGAEADASMKQGSDVWEDLSNAKTCHNCGSIVLAAEMKLHLQYCIDSDDENDQSFSDEGKRFNENSCAKDAPNQGVVSCPSCMEKVKEDKIQEHLDQCLTYLAEEF